MENFYPFFGVVEDVKDPEKLGRVRVRCYGYHSHNLGFVPTEMLQWFYAITNNRPGVSGLGETVQYVQGSTVFGFIVDKELQNGIVLGSLVSKPSRQLFENMGFTDPDKVYPFYYDESDVNRIARNENIDKTIVEYKRKTAVKNIPGVNGTWSEPETPYATQYPHNKVFETTSGHVVEYDDTPGAERISINHRKGSFVEYHPNGDKVDRVAKDGFSIFLGGSFIFVNGNMNMVVGGDLDQHVMGNYNLKVGGSVNIDSSVVNMGGDLNVAGESSAKDHVSNGVSGEKHEHPGVQSGPSKTQPPIASGSFSAPLTYSGSPSYSVSVSLFDPSIRLT